MFEMSRLETVVPGHDERGALERMKNLGPVSAARLQVVGIEGPDDLRRVGAVDAYVRLTRAFPAETTHVSLYALHGAVIDVRWYSLSEETKAVLRAAAARR
jgi:DNA transformation protein